MGLSTGARLTIGEKSAPRSVALELSKATWLIAHQPDRPQSTQSPDLDYALSLRNPEEDTLGRELFSCRK